MPKKKPSSVVIFADGGSRGNPGPSASAFVAIRNGRLIYQESEYLGESTNNLAEYGAVFMAMRWLSERHPAISLNKVDFFLDSQLVVNQLNGKFKVKNEKIRRYFNKIKAIEKTLSPEVNYRHVARSENKIADGLVNKKLDELDSVSR